MTHEKHEDEAHIPSLNNKKTEPENNVHLENGKIALQLAKKTAKQFQSLEEHLLEQDGILQKQDKKLNELSLCDNDLQENINKVSNDLQDRVKIVDFELIDIKQKHLELEATLKENRKERRDDINRTFDKVDDHLKTFREDTLSVIKANTLSTRWTIPIMFTLLIAIMSVALYGVYNNYQMIIHHTGYFALILNL